MFENVAAGITEMEWKYHICVDNREDNDTAAKDHMEMIRSRYEHTLKQADA